MPKRFAPLERNKSTVGNLLTVIPPPWPSMYEVHNRPFRQLPWRHISLIQPVYEPMSEEETGCVASPERKKTP